MIKKLIHFFFYSKIELINNIDYLQSELYDKQKLIRSFAEIIEREREYNLNRRMKRRNAYWRKSNKNFKIKWL